MSVIIPPSNNNDPTDVKYFYPGFVKVSIGQSIRWINTDSKDHYLIFTKDQPEYGKEIGMINAGKSFSKTFTYYVPKLDYTCKIHPEEQGSIVMYPKNENDMTNTQNLRHLDELFDINPNEPLTHLRSIRKGEREKIIEILESSNITVEKFLDPYIYNSLSNPNLFKLQIKNMTVVFWDISEFSNLCNTLMHEPIYLAGFLNEYINKAIEVIHKFNGIVDKIIGDGILAYFGLHNHDETHGALNSINAANELRKSFQLIKNRWMGIWIAYNNYEINIGLKCGIHTGDVLFGLLDTNTRCQITVTGSTVNLASRLEGEAHDQQIIISPSVKDILGTKVQTNSISIPKGLQSFPDIKEIYEVI